MSLAEVRLRPRTIMRMQGTVTETQPTKKEVRRKQQMMMCMRFYHQLAMKWLGKSCMTTQGICENSLLLFV
jgi:hypothetical protein